MKCYEFVQAKNVISIQKIEKVRTFKYLEITASDMDIEINEIPLYFCTHDPVIRKKYRMYVSKSPSEHIFFKTLHLPIERLLLAHPPVELVLHGTIA
jgi:hypothetical protein